MTDLPFLRSYGDWRHCITKACRIPLTLAFIEARIAALNDPAYHGTQQFAKTWGTPHLERVKGWFRQARDEFARDEPGGESGA